jgi:hypothetical protein
MIDSRESGDLADKTIPICRADLADRADDGGEAAFDEMSGTMTKRWCVHSMSTALP